MEFTFMSTGTSLREKILAAPMILQGKYVVRTQLILQTLIAILSLQIFQDSMKQSSMTMKMVIGGLIKTQDTMGLFI